MSSFKSKTTGVVLSAAVLSFNSLPLQAQVLEEVVVTAQRRAQSLQEVPISIETMSGVEIREQGFRNMEDLSQFSPSVVIQGGVQDQHVTVRGVGTIGNSLTLEQAVPVFVDGIHYGRQSQIKTAFLDIDRVEILKGPQPVYFGQNASAGAFNIQTKKPTPQWEGEVDATFGNNSERELTFGAGGPITDTLGIRIAGAREESAGFLINPVSFEKLPRYDMWGGRVTLQWNPNDKFQVTPKFEYSRLRNGGETLLGCKTEGSAIYARGGEGGPTTGIGNAFGQSNGTAVWLDPPQGIGHSFYPELGKLSDECFKGNMAVSQEGPYLQMPDTIYDSAANIGSVEARRVASAATSQSGNYYLGEGIDAGGLSGKDWVDAWTAVMNLQYSFDNDIELESITGYNTYKRNAIRDNRFSPFFQNNQSREENYSQWSSELRLSSPVGGTIEWMGAVSWQTDSKDHLSSQLTANTHRSERFNILWEDVTLLNAFATVTFNFLDNRASIDLGARYSDVDKTVYITGFGANWVFDVEPVSRPGYIAVDPATVRFLQPGAGPNLWTYPYNLTRNTPVEWWPGTGVEAVGLSSPDYARRLAAEVDGGQPLTDEFSDSFIDPQVTLRYRAGDNHSLFARWARASKGAGYDTGQSSIPSDIDEMRFETEKAESFEIGSKGTVWDGRARYDVTLFRTTFTDLQLSGLAPIREDNQVSESLNAGEQRVQGVEFSIVTAVTDQWTVGLNAAIMDGKMTEFDGSGCNATELYNTLLDLNIPGVLPCQLFDDEGNTYEKTDRSGTQSPRTPDYKFVLTSTYTIPVWDNYEVGFTAKGYISDGYITSRSAFDRTIMFNKHGDLNLQLGFGDRDGTWKLSAYANNIFEARESYNEEFDVLPLGVAGMQPNAANFMTYGLRFGYNFR